MPQKEAFLACRSSHKCMDRRMDSPDQGAPRRSAVHSNKGIAQLAAFQNDGGIVRRDLHGSLQTSRRKRLSRRPLGSTARLACSATGADRWNRPTRTSRFESRGLNGFCFRERERPHRFAAFSLCLHVPCSRASETASQYPAPLVL